MRIKTKYKTKRNKIKYKKATEKNQKPQHTFTVLYQ